jgi:hypothetical protein
MTVLALLSDHKVSEEKPAAFPFQGVNSGCRRLAFLAFAALFILVFLIVWKS